MKNAARTMKNAAPIGVSLPDPVCRLARELLRARKRAMRLRRLAEDRFHRDVTGCVYPHVNDVQHAEALVDIARERLVKEAVRSVRAQTKR